MIRMGGKDSVSIFLSLSHKSHALARKSFSGGVPVRSDERFFVQKIRAEMVNESACNSFDL